MTSEDHTPPKGPPIRSHWIEVATIGLFLALFGTLFVSHFSKSDGPLTNQEMYKFMSLNCQVKPFHNNVDVLPDPPGSTTSLHDVAGLDGRKI